MTKYLRGLTLRFFAGLLALTFIFAHNAYSKAIQLKSSMDGRTLAMINKPGVVLVQTVWTADITLSEFSFVDGFEEDLVNAITELVTNGTIPNTEEAMYSAMVQLMIEHMGDYVYSTGNVSSEKVSTAAVGTGFIITPDGYLITNAHVVATDEEELSRNFAMTALQNYAVESTNSFVADMKSLGYQMSQEEIDGFMNTFFYLLAAHMEIGNLQTSYQCFLGNVTSEGEVGAKGVGLDLRKMGVPIPGKDVAVLKLDKTNLPTVALGDDSKLRTGDRVYAMGYPAVATISEALNISKAIQEPTMTSGIISARKEMADGWSILQTDAAIHGGNSGGPLFNEDGEVIGINTFGMIDPNSGSQVTGMNFAIPISIATEFLNEINVKPAESEFTKQYKKAIDLYQKEKYNQALEILRNLSETNPGIPVVAELLAECSALAEKYPEKSSRKSGIVDKIGGNTILFIIIGVAGTGVIVLIMVIVLKKNKKKSIITPYVTPIEILGRPDTVTCPSCGNSIPLGSKFCSACGYSYSLKPAAPGRCPRCSAVIQPGSKFCNECGEKIND